MSDRKTRAAIEHARADGIIIINSQNGAGYFQTTDLDEMLRQYRQDTARALSIFRRRKPLREALIAAGVRVDDGLLTVYRDMHGRFASDKTAGGAPEDNQQSLF